MSRRGRRKLTPREAFGEALREFRRRGGLTQEELAFAGDRSPRHVSDLERAKYSPSLDTLFALADALDTRPSEMLRRAEALIGYQ